MGLWSKIKGEFIDIVEWTDDSNSTLVYRFERHGNEIKYGAQLVVREGQKALFVNEGKLADIFDPGTYTLETKNIPILSTLKGWKYGFSSPFKAEVYFVSMRQFVDLKWGLKNPIMLRDKEFGPVRLRAFGNYSIKVKDPKAFILQLVSTDNRFSTNEISSQLRNIIVARFADILGESKIPVLDLAANYDELGEFIASKITDEFNSYGLDLTKVLVENISLPPAVEEALDKRSSMGVIGNLGAYTQFQTAEAMTKAAENPGGMAGGGMGMGMGFAMANQMAHAQTQHQAPQQQAPQPQAAPAAPPPVPGQKKYHLALNGQSVGPFGSAELQQKIQSKELTKETLAWSEGMANWQKASEIEDIAKLFGSAPPPIPGA